MTRYSGSTLAKELADQAQHAEAQARLSIDAAEARRRAARAEGDARRWARRHTAVPAHQRRGKSRKLERMLQARRDAIFYTRLAGRLEEIDHDAGPGLDGDTAAPAIAFHALTIHELEEIDRAALHDLDGEIRAANYTPPGGTP